MMLMYGLSQKSHQANQCYKDYGSILILLPFMLRKNHGWFTDKCVGYRCLIPHFLVRVRAVALCSTIGKRAEWMNVNDSSGTPGVLFRNYNHISLIIKTKCIYDAFYSTSSLRAILWQSEIFNDPHLLKVLLFLLLHLLLCWNRLSAYNWFLWR
jgi:hypothetical protein